MKRNIKKHPAMISTFVLIALYIYIIAMSAYVIHPSHNQRQPELPVLVEEQEIIETFIKRHPDES